MSNTVTRSIAELVTLARRTGEDVALVKDMLLREWLKQELKAQGGNQCKLAESLGVHRNTASRYLAELKIPRKTQVMEERHLNAYEQFQAQQERDRDFSAKDDTQHHRDRHLYSDFGKRRKRA